MSRGYAPKLAAAGGPSPAAGGRTSETAARSGPPTTPYHCPFCGDEDLRPVEDDAAAWVCRSCARVFTVRLLRLDYAAVPAHRARAQADRDTDGRPHQDTDEQPDQKGRDR